MTTARNLFAAAAVAAISLSSAAPLLGQKTESWRSNDAPQGISMLNMENSTDLDVSTVRSSMFGSAVDSATANLDVRSKLTLAIVGTRDAARIQVSASHLYNQGVADVDVALNGNTRWRRSIQRSGELRLPANLSTKNIGGSLEFPIIWGINAQISVTVGMATAFDMEFDLGDGVPMCSRVSQRGELGLQGSASTKATFDAKLGAGIPGFSVKVGFVGDLAEQSAKPDFMASVANGIRGGQPRKQGPALTRVREAYEISINLHLKAFWVINKTFKLLGPYRGSAKTQKVYWAPNRAQRVATS